MKWSNLAAVVQFIGVIACFQLSIFGFFYWKSSTRKHRQQEHFLYVHEHGLLKKDDTFFIPKDIIEQVKSVYHTIIEKEVSIENSVYLKKELQHPNMKPIDTILLWNPDDINIPIIANDMVQYNVPRFDFMNDQQNRASISYRDADLPFVLFNIPLLTDTSALWTNEFFRYKFGNTKRDVEVSESNKFVYYTLKNKLSFGSNLVGWKAPQKDVSMTYEEFSNLMNATDNINIVQNNRNSSHYYLTISAREGLRTDWVTEAFPYFTSKDDELIAKRGFDVFRRNSEHLKFTKQAHPETVFRDTVEYKGINCRIGSAGSSAAAHFDSHGNFVALVRGIRRYILIPPNQCNKLHLYPKSHPSARHSSIDWGNASQVYAYESVCNKSIPPPLCAFLNLPEAYVS